MSEVDQLPSLACLGKCGLDAGKFSPCLNCLVESGWWEWMDGPVGIVGCMSGGYEVVERFMEVVMVVEGWMKTNWLGGLRIQVEMHGWMPGGGLKCL
ncbi:hypothetical protein Pcinc_034492 [Petrolisthes cinctipes]|uniref:Uncharacterized protein n=1 Tax=Petrolisthes cinctipes TaxID=88211 RepID=A0AAE1JVK4_PETCI|nr:hypothetical protein Pcinc_034492 [Petrolisthes cinctipes]